MGLEKKLNIDRIECGVDEVGRGCLAGPVFAAAVIFPDDYYSEEIMDSKKLSKKKRERLVREIEDNALCFSVEMVTEDFIDKFNIQNATYGAMNKAIENLSVTPEHILVDGNSFDTTLDIPYTCVVKGDDKYMSIAAASILAKVYRDEYMDILHTKHPEYKWDKNKGYGSKHHIDTIKSLGITNYHRKTFLKNILNECLVK